MRHRAVEPTGSRLSPYSHPEGLRLLVPEQWELSENARPGLVLVAVEPETAETGGSGFRANLVVTSEQLPAGLDLESWQTAMDTMLPSALDDYTPVTLDRVEIGGWPAVRRLVRHRSKGGTEVTMEQWSTVLGSPDGTGAAGGAAQGWSLTASTATAVYAARAELFSQVAASWRPPAPGAVAG